MADRELVDTIISVFYPFISIIMKEGFNKDAIICLILWIVFRPASVWYYYCKKENFEFIHAYLCLYFPPIGLLMAKGKGCEGEVITCLLLTLVCVYPGVIYAFMKA